MDDRVAIAPEARDAATDVAIVERARRRGIRRFVLSSTSTVVTLPGEERIVRTADGLSVPGARGPIVVRRIGEHGELDRAIAATPEDHTLVVEWTTDRVIPLEWAVARRGRRFRLWTFARTSDEVPSALGALEHGADLVILTAHEAADIDRLESVLERVVPPSLDWQLVPVRSVRPAGPGDRVVVDTTSLLGPAEGLLVGSAAAFLFHVASEAVGSAFSRPRPFRVNAGSAHSYVLMADGTTRYLSELEPGDAVLASVPNGSSRPVRVGRIKIERRPLSVVTAADGERARTVFLQEAETVRLSGEKERTALTDLTEGTLVHGVRLPAARHLGAAIDETIEER